MIVIRPFRPQFERGVPNATGDLGDVADLGKLILLAWAAWRAWELVTAGRTGRRASASIIGQHRQRRKAKYASQSEAYAPKRQASQPHYEEAVDQ